MATDKFVKGPALAWPAPFSATFEARMVAVVVSVKVTLPVGVPAPDVTVAVKVTACRKLDGFWLLPTVQLVGAGHLRVNVSVHPLEKLPLSVLNCGKTYKPHVPLGSMPPKVLVKVAEPSAAGS